MKRTMHKATDSESRRGVAQLRRRFGALIVALTAATGLALVPVASPAAAATGDILRTIVTTPGSGCSVGVGITFVDSELLTSCYNNSSSITRVDPADGDKLGTYSITGIPAGEGIGAMSWDDEHNILWVGSGTISPQRVYSVVLDSSTHTGVATLAFTHTLGGYSIIDGLAYDGSDDSLWLSPDVDQTVYHYSMSGTLLGSFSVSGKLGGCGASGLAVADATTLYIANNGCEQIYSSDKSGTAISLFAQLPSKRVEDLECDNQTFAPRSVIWSKDAYDDELNAFEVPAGQCAQGGVVDRSTAPDIEITCPATPVAVDTTVTVSGELTDPDGSAWSADVDWGDGNTDTDASVTPGALSFTHAYAAPGVYEVAATVEDSTALTDTDSCSDYVVVYDPSAGFVTGGGWIDSPAGAYAADLGLSGKANFGFVAKYKKGATVPDGNTQFQFHAGNLNFHSTVYEWLVVSGPKAQYKGAGTINGAGNYGFILTAHDGQVAGGGDIDRFRIKIWDKSSGSVVYDNQSGDADTSAASDAVEGGSIVIHAKK